MSLASIVGMSSKIERMEGSMQLCRVSRVSPELSPEAWRENQNQIQVKTAAHRQIVLHTNAPNKTADYCLSDTQTF